MKRLIYFVFLFCCIILCGCNKKWELPEQPADNSGEAVIVGNDNDYTAVFPFSNLYNSIAIVVDMGSDEEEFQTSVDKLISTYLHPSMRAEAMRMQLKEAERVALGTDAYYLFIPRYNGTSFSVTDKKDKPIASFCDAFILITNRADSPCFITATYEDITDTVCLGAASETTEIKSLTNHIYDLTMALHQGTASMTDPLFYQQLVSIAAGKIHYDVENQGLDAPLALWNAILCAASQNVASAYYNDEGNIVLYADELSVYSHALYSTGVTELPPLPDTIECTFDTEKNAYIFKPITTGNISYSFSEINVTDTGCLLYIEEIKNGKTMHVFQTDWQYAEGGMGMQLVSFAIKD